MTADRTVLGLDEAQAAAVNEIRADYYDKLIGTHTETEDRIMAATGLKRPAANWLLMSNDPAVAGPLPEEAFR